MSGLGSSTYHKQRLMSRPGFSLSQVERGEQIIVSIDGQPVQAFAGESVAAVLLSQGIRTFRHTAKMGEGRGIFCGIGICYDCLVTVDGVANQRACLTLVAAGCAIETRPGAAWRALTSDPPLLAPVDEAQYPAPNAEAAA